MAEDYTFAELRDVHYLYGVAEGYARKAERLYRERFPNRRHPSQKMFVSIHQRLDKIESLRPKKIMRDAQHMLEPLMQKRQYCIA
jgi:hypothetical protein